jgi:hypothetical protein
MSVAASLPGWETIGPFFDNPAGPGNKLVAASLPSMWDLENVLLSMDDLASSGGWFPYDFSKDLGVEYQLAAPPPMGDLDGMASGKQPPPALDVTFTNEQQQPPRRDGAYDSYSNDAASNQVATRVPSPLPDLACDSPSMPMSPTGTLWNAASNQGANRVPSPLPDFACDSPSVYMSPTGTLWNAASNQVATRVPSPLPDFAGESPSMNMSPTDTLNNMLAGLLHVPPSRQPAAWDGLGMPELDPHLQVPSLDGSRIAAPGHVRPALPPRARRVARPDRRGGGAVVRRGRGRRGGGGRAQAQAQPRRIRRPAPPVITPVELRDDDVVCERGGINTSHQGNISYRLHVEDVVRGGGRSYGDLPVREKTALRDAVVDWVHNQQGGRFVAWDTSEGLWYQVSTVTAREKVSQRLRDVHGRLLETTVTVPPIEAGGDAA